MFSYHGGQLWIDFVNTQILNQGEVRDRIGMLHDFVEWYRQAGTDVSSFEQEVAETSDEDAALIWTRLKELRTMLRTMSSDTVDQQEVAAEYLEALNARLAEVAGHWQIALSGEEQQMLFLPQGSLYERLSWPILQSVMSFVVAHQFKRLKRCTNHQCIQYYFDTSKNNTRRWCRMEVCGNREKARRHYQKRSAGASGDYEAGGIQG